MRSRVKRLLVVLGLGCLLPLRTVYGQIVVSEMMSSNTQTIQDEDGDTPDWVELWNSSPDPVNLAGWFLTDDALEPDKWQFPSVTLPPDAYLLVFASDKDRKEGPFLHTNFRMGAGREPVLLYNPSGQQVDNLPVRCIPDNVSLGKDPANPALVFHFARPTPGAFNDVNSRFTITEGKDTVLFSHPAGVYPDAFAVTLSVQSPASRLHYTLDGTTPDESSPLYAGLLTITNRTAQESDISAEETSPRWTPPQGPVQKATVVRAVAYQDGCPVSPVMTNTYFVHPSFRSRYRFPVFSLSVDRSDFFGNRNGIYVAGKSPDGMPNYFQSGGNWERSTHLEYFAPTGERVLSQTVGARIHGRGSRENPQKSIRLYADQEYGKARLDYPFFADLPITSFRRLILRSPDADFSNTLFKDELIHTLLRGTNLDLQAVLPTLVFLNGEYWGIHHLRERQDRYYLNSHYGYSPGNVDILGYDTGDEEVIEGDKQHYQNMLQYIRENDLSVPEHYAYISTQMEVDNFIDYQIAHLFLANFDWPFNNIRYWRPRRAGGRWRWFFFDCDACLSKFSLTELSKYIPPAPTDDPSRFLLQQLLRNADFRNQFVSRFYYHLNTTFEPGRVITTINQFRDTYAPMVAEHVARWNSPPSIDAWLASLEEIKRFALQRPVVMLRQLEELLPTPFVLYPNPATDQLFVQGPIDASLRVTLLNSVGQVVLSPRLYDPGSGIPVSSLSPGLYLVQLQYGKLVFHYKLQIVR